jgi:hypothetical protein
MTNKVVKNKDIIDPNKTINISSNACQVLFFKTKYFIFKNVLAITNVIVQKVKFMFFFPEKKKK